jgi:hypothetical protein
MAQTVTRVSGNTYAYFNGSTTTNYDITTARYDASNAAAFTTNNPWWTNPADSSTSRLFAASVAGNTGVSQQGGFGPLFQFRDTGMSVYNIRGGSVETYNSGITLSSSFTYAVATASSSGSSAGVPEIDGSLAPKVGFLLACLFLMFGRKRQDLAPALSA